MNGRSTTAGLALAALLAVSALPEARQATARRNTPTTWAQAGARGGGSVTSPDVAADRRVTFRFRAPNAREVVVSVAGERLNMHMDEAGVWSVTTEPLSPDVYAYTFFVDGAAITDPSNREYQTSFRGFQNMFFVPGPAPWLPKPGIPRGAVARHVFHSVVAGDDREFFVYTPPAYDPKRPQAYPVLYLLHGLGDDAGRWVNAGAANVILDNLIAAGTAVPMVMVAPLGYGTDQGPAGARSVESVRNYPRILLEEVMPLVERGYHVSADRTQRAIAGLSMGGAQAVFTALNHVDRFAWVASFSGAFTMWPGVSPSSPRGAPAPVGPRGFDANLPAVDASVNPRLQMLWITCGTADSLIGVNRQFKAWLRSKNVEFTEQEIPDVGHVWPLWRQNVAELAGKLFK